MLRGVLFWAGALALGAILGIGSALAVVAIGPGLSAREIAGWRYDPATGAEPEDGYARAFTATRDLMGLSRREELVFTLTRDDRERPFDEACVYELRGGPLPARFWSVTLYANDGYLPRNPDRAISFNSTRAEADASLNWAVRIAPIRGDASHWMSSRDARRNFSLQLRLYQPRQDARDDPDAITLPSVRTISCPGSA